MSVRNTTGFPTVTALTGVGGDPSSPNIARRPTGVVISNEFASIEVRAEAGQNGDVAVIVDRLTGRSRRVDVLLLAWLVTLPEVVMRSLPDPGVSERFDGSHERSS